MTDSDEAIAEFKALMRDPAARKAFVEIRAKAEEEGVRMRYEHILKAVGGSPWAIREDVLFLICDLLAFRAAGGQLEPAEVAERIGTARRGRAPSAPAGVGVIPLHGVIVPKGGLLTEVSGATSVESFRAMYREAMASPDIGAVVLDVNSPGGMVDQIPEMAAEMRAFRGRKPVVAVANTEADSGAYWLASQADEIVATKSGRVGSIGVLTAHEDVSRRDEERGVRTTLISAGRYKTEGNPFEPLSEDAKAHVQGLVDDYYGMFVSDVAEGRSVPVEAVREGFGQGRVVGAREALAGGMVDRIGTLEEVVRGLLETTQAARPAALAVGAPTSTFSISVPGSEAQAFLAQVDDSPWDGDAAMGGCDEAACFRAICAGERNVGEPNERQHWALPHHKRPGAPPNAAGTRNALSRLPQTQGLVNREAAQAHLDRHMSAISPESVGRGSEITTIEAELDTLRSE